VPNKIFLILKKLIDGKVLVGITEAQWTKGKPKENTQHSQNTNSFLTCP
jgi:hypothetical protein